MECLKGKGHDFLREASGLQVCQRCGASIGAKGRAGKQPGRSFADGLDKHERAARYEMLDEFENPWSDDESTDRQYPSAEDWRIWGPRSWED